MKHLIVLALALLTVANLTAKKKQDKPNIIYILADDMGFGDLSCNGQEKFTTPNLDKLTAQGMSFTEHYTGSAVCAPSRSTLMTGQHTGHTPIRNNKELVGREGQSPMPASTLTVAEVLKKAGYTTGAFGKWGLGFIGSEGDAINQGFDLFYGYNCQRMAHRYYPPYLWRNDEKVVMPGNDWTNTVTYAPDVIQEETLQFIEDNKDNPFYAYVPLIQPHAELLVPNDSILQKFLGKFPEDKPYVKHKYLSDYGPDIVEHKYCSQEYPRAVFASMIYRLDVYVGQIMAKVDELGIADNTIIMFASDNGPHDAGGADPEYFNSNGPYKGIKRDLYEGGVRTPFIVRWPNQIKPGSSSDHISAFWDFLPTCADIAGVKVDSQIDGISFLPSLTGKGKQKEHEYLYWEFSVKAGRQAVRMGKWKAVIYDIANKKKPGKLELYNLDLDIGEENNVVDQYPEIAAKMRSIMKKEHTPSDVYPMQIID